MGNDILGLKIRELAQKNSGAKALTFYKDKSVSSYSFVDLESLACKVAHHLAKHSCPIGIFCDKTCETYAIILACHYAGMTFVPLNPRLPQQRLLEIIKVAKIEMILTDPLHKDQLREMIDGHSNITSWAVDASDFLSLPLPTSSSPVVRKPEDILYILFTSGSTGTPKAVPISNQNMQVYLDSYSQFLGLTTQEKVSQTHDLSFDLALGDIFFSFSQGHTLCPMLLENMYSLPQYLEQLEITVLSAVPSLGKTAVDLSFLKSGSLPKLKRIISCGERLPVTLAKAWQLAAPQAKIANAYGPTEATVNALMFWYNTQHTTDQHDEQRTYGQGSVPIGKPLGSVKTLLIDSNLQEVSAGTAGQLLLSGDQIFSGYLNVANENTFVSLKGQQWYRTGDLVIEDSSGDLTFLGRLDWQLKVRGRRVEAEELENLFATALPDVTVFFFPSEKDVYGDALSLRAVLISRRKISQAEIFKALQVLKENTFSAFLPDKIHQMDNLPLTPHGKADRQKISLLPLTEMRQLYP